MKEFQAVFQMSKIILFEVKFYTLGRSKTPYFTTSAEEFLSGKSDYARCGQAQKDLLQNFPVAKAFWEKWDELHLHNLTEAQYDELQKDLDVLKEEYNYVHEEFDDTYRPYNPYFKFRRLVEFSKQEPKRKGT